MRFALGVLLRLSYLYLPPRAGDLNGSVVGVATRGPPRERFMRVLALSVRFVPPGVEVELTPRCIVPSPLRGACVRMTLIRHTHNGQGQ